MVSSRDRNGRHDAKRQRAEPVEDRPSKRLKALLEEDDSSYEEAEKTSGHDSTVQDDESATGDHSFRINHDFARRFEHNKKRDELHKREYCLLYTDWDRRLT